mgnify:CR=1 FL=1
MHRIVFVSLLLAAPPAEADVPWRIGRRVMARSDRR